MRRMNETIVLALLCSFPSLSRLLSAPAFPPLPRHPRFFPAGFLLLLLSSRPPLPRRNNRFPAPGTSGQSFATHHSARPLGIVQATSKNSRTPCRNLFLLCQ